MRCSLFLCHVAGVIAMLAAAARTQAAPNFRLGVEHSGLVAVDGVTSGTLAGTGVDGQGSLYLLVNTYGSNTSRTVPTGLLYNSWIVKLTAGADSVVWQRELTLQAEALAVDPLGNVYVSGYDSSGPAVVEKLGTDGATVVYKTTIGQEASALAVDSSGRAYAAGSANGYLPTTPGAFQQQPPDFSPAFVVRLKADGAIDYATWLGGSRNEAVAAIAVDNSGSAFVAGNTWSPDFPVTPGAFLATPSIDPNFGQAFLTRLAADGSRLTYSTFMNTPGQMATGVVLDSSDDAVVALTTGTLGGLIHPGFAVRRFNPQGTAVTLSTALQGASPYGLNGLALDGSGNIYVATAPSVDYQTRNSVATCDQSQAALAVFDNSGNILQSTYLPGASAVSGVGVPSLGLAVLPDSTVAVLTSASSNTPQQRSFSPSAGSVSVLRLSQNSAANTVQLACLGNAASFDTTAIAGGEMVSLFGDGIGPAAGTQPPAGFPKLLAGVQVTFNGIPAPLSYVQDGQINAIAPWSIQSAQTVEVCAAYNGTTTNCLSRPVGPDPGVFTVDGYHAAAVNQDGTVNSAAHPAKVGSVVAIYATGTGPLTPAQADGAIVEAPLPVNAFSISMSWDQPVGHTGLRIQEPVTVRNAGPAAGAVAGLTRIQFVVPDNGVSPLILQVQAPGSAPVASAAFQLYETQP